MSGLSSYHAGLAAEEQVASRYVETGHRVLSRRWRGQAGELDLVVEKDGEIVFVEVKKSSSFARAAERLSRRQMARIFRSAEDFLGHMAGGLNAACRIDVALVDRSGRIDLRENAITA